MTKKIPTIEPIGKNILVKPDEQKSKVSESGLITPANVEQEQKAIGEVIAVGDMIDHIKKGDKVIYGVYSGDDVEIAGVRYKILSADPDEKEVLAFLR